jgi:hypothetical protein
MMYDTTGLQNVGWYLLIIITFRSSSSLNYGTGTESLLSYEKKFFSRKKCPGAHSFEHTRFYAQHEKYDEFDVY